MSSSEDVNDDVPLRLRYYKRKCSGGGGEPSSSKRFGRPGPASSMSSNLKTTQAGPMSSKRKSYEPATALVDRGPSASMSKFNLHLQSNSRKIGYVSIDKGHEELLIKSSFMKMFLCKDDIKEEKVELEPDVNDVGSSKNATNESNFTLLQDLEYSSSGSDDNDRDDNDDDMKNSDSDTSSEEELENMNETNNNDEDSSITISSDSEDEVKPQTVKSPATSRTKHVPKKMSITDRFRLLYENYEGTGKKRRVRCKLCPGTYILTFRNFHKHVANVHENHERKECEFCHKDFSHSYIKEHRRICEKKAAWSQIEFKEVN